MKKKRLLYALLMCCILMCALGSNQEAFAEDNSHIEILHTHDGDNKKGGGCYGIPNACGGSFRSWTETIRCNNTNWAFNSSTGCYYCPKDGYNNGTSSSGQCPKVIATYNHYNCTRCGIGSGSTPCQNITSYSLDCGIDEGTKVGDLTITKNTEEWQKELILSATYNSYNENFVINENPYSWNGGEFVASNEFVITENGTHTCLLNSPNTDVSTLEASIEILNIDDILPIISSISKNTEEWTNQDITLTVEASDNEMGLADAPYSWDGGTTWISENTYVISENGTYEVWVKDKADNTTTQSITVTNIDKYGSTVTSIAWDETLEIENTTVSITAEDLQPDGTQGVGLHDTPYSWDKGVSWEAEPTHLYRKNGTYEVWVKDKLENIGIKEFTITNIDDTAPLISNQTYYPGSWTNQNVTLEIDAFDASGIKEGAEGTGLHDTPYSWDKGASWGTSKTYKAESNGTYEIWVRDRCENIAIATWNITNIDKTAPVISWSMSPELKDWFTGKATVTVNATDEPSGVQQISFDDGRTWGSSNTIEFEDTISIKLRVRDLAGNEAFLDIYLEKQLIPVIEEEPIELPPEEEVINTIIPEKKEEVKIEELPPISIPLPPKKEKVKEVVQEEKASKPPTGLLQKAVVGSAAATSGGACIFLFTYIFSFVNVYGKNIEGKYILLGRTFLRKKKDKYIIKVANRLLKKADASEYQIILGKRFTKKNQGKDIVLKVNKNELLRKVNGELYF